MNQLHEEHPDPAQLAAFLEGVLTEEERSSVESHVEHCQVCCDVMAAVPMDGLAAQIRDIGDEVDTNAEAWSVVTEPGFDKAVAQGPQLPDALQGHNRYRILEPLGKGGMGVVFKAQHRVMDRIVALKVIDSSLIDNPRMVERFRNEVKAAALLTHPNIVRAYDAEQAGNLHFLVMEYVDGISLSELVRRKGPLPVDQALGVIRKVAHGLHHAFQQGMVHRDIKPGNIMVTRTGKVRILDFGLARLARERQQITDSSVDLVPPDAPGDALTLAGSILGTPDYIAPEQVQDSRSADTRADIYSLGCTAWFLLTGQPPYPTGTAIQKLTAHREQTPEPLTNLRAELDEPVVQLISRMMERNPEDRFQRPKQVALAIEALTPGMRNRKLPSTTGIGAPDSAEATLPQTQAKLAAGEPSAQVSSRSHKRVAAVAVLAVVMLFGAFAVHFNRPEDSNEGSGFQAPPPPVMAEDEDEWQELVWLAAPEDAVAGNRQRLVEGLRVSETPSARIPLPYDFPPEYDFRVQFTRNTGEHSIAVIFVAGGKQAAFDIDAWGEHLVGIQRIGEDDLKTLPNPGNFTISNGQKYTAEVRVRADKVEALIDGKLICTYTGDGSDLNMIREWVLPDHPDSLAVGAYASDTTFHQIRIRRVSEGSGN